MRYDPQQLKMAFSVWSQLFGLLATCSRFTACLYLLITLLVIVQAGITLGAVYLFRKLLRANTWEV